MNKNEFFEKIKLMFVSGLTAEDVMKNISDKEEIRILMRLSPYQLDVEQKEYWDVASDLVKWKKEIFCQILNTGEVNDITTAGLYLIQTHPDETICFVRGEIKKVLKGNPEEITNFSSQISQIHLPCEVKPDLDTLIGQLKNHKRRKENGNVRGGLRVIRNRIKTGYKAPGNASQ